MIIVIIDFDNYFGTDVSKLTPELLELAFSDIVLICMNEFNKFNKVQIRLYGGWYNNTSLTKQASIVQQLLSRVNIFPIIKDSNIIHGNIRTVSSLYSVPGFEWYHTYKETNGIPRIRINHDLVDDFCKDNKTLCPKFLLYKLTANKEKKCHVDNCNNLHKNIFKGVVQKMVDTLLACDIISASEDEDVKGIFVLSDDQDHFPSFAIAQTKQIKKEEKSKFLLGVKNKQKEPFITQILSPFNVKTIIMQ